MGWVYTGTITGNDSGVININSCTNAELAGDISGVLNVNVGNLRTDAFAGCVAGPGGMEI